MCFNHNASNHGFARIILVAATLAACACVADDTKEGASEGSVAADEGPGGAAAGSANSAPYSVDCGHVNEDGESFCYVDGDTYLGWRTFHGFCHVCHAQDAVGSTFAPNLLDRMRQSDMTRDLFVKRLEEGFTGQVGVMPAWKDNPNVSKRYNELYAYLMARASGALPPGRPTKQPKSE